MVVGFGKQYRGEIEVAVDRPDNVGARLKGCVFNDMTVSSRRYAYAGYKYYRYSN